MSGSHWNKVVLGIDAAWTSGNPSGVSLLAFDGTVWRCLAVAPSYQQFLDYHTNKSVDWSLNPLGGVPVIEELLAKAVQLSDGKEPDVIAVDMPLSNLPITTRREADDSISREFGSNWCAVHSPSADRPGQISDNFSAACKDAGYSLSTTDGTSQTLLSLIEVYPHTAILKLLDLDYRHTYKVSNASRYWPEASAEEKKQLLVQSLQMVIDALAVHIQGIEINVPSNPADVAFNHLKRYEDVVDSLVCAWVAVKYLQYECTPYGDECAAIWTP